MTTFNLKNYEDTSSTDNTKDVSTAEPDNTTTEQVQHAEITITGTISEIIAKSLYEVFPNVETISQESLIDGIHIKVPSGVNKNIRVVTLTTEEIKSNPLESFRKANSSESLVYIETNDKPFTSREEDWFLSNISSEHFYNIDELQSKIRTMING